MAPPGPPAELFEMAEVWIVSVLEEDHWKCLQSIEQCLAEGVDWKCLQLLKEVLSLTQEQL